MRKCKAVVVSVLIIPLALTVSGCATIINSSHQSVPITSSPQGASVTIDSADQKYTTPAEVKMERKRDHTLFFSKEGYEDLTFVIKHGVSGAVWGNLLAGGLIGWGVDATTGAQFKLMPETVNVTLAKKGDEKAIAEKRTITQRLDELDTLLTQKRITPAEYDKLKIEALNNQNK